MDFRVLYFIAALCTLSSTCWTVMLAYSLPRLYKRWPRWTTAHRAGEATRYGVLTILAMIMISGSTWLWFGTDFSKLPYGVLLAAVTMAGIYTGAKRYVRLSRTQQRRTPPNVPPRHPITKEIAR